jgi:sulfur carrier protein
MEIVINGTAHQVADDMSLERAVALISNAASGVAAAVNGELVRRVSWASTRLAAGDEVEVLTAVQGG